MIWRVRDRATFEALRRQGRRARRGPVTVVYLAAASPVPRAAFAVSRKVGGAVVRNRLRRRLRAILRDLAEGPGGAGLAPGTYLVTVRPEVTALPYGELAELVRSACAAATAAAASPGADR